ncbi:dihydrodipicolinate synthase family protein [Orbus mooreae]|uniref:dihydrodipicolinate synthase family protein n=1 Tax=Orbus mooreae TaxID=3074107 RepID=UPI00370D3DFE
MRLQQNYHIAIPTAFTIDEKLNIQSTLDYIISLQNIGIKSVLVSGSTGEQHSLTFEEKKQIIEAIEKDVRIRADFEIIFGVSSIRLKEAQHLAKVIETKTKISSLMVGFPPYIIPTQKESQYYVESIDDLTSKNIILYNNPKRTGFDLEISTCKRLFLLSNIIGIKEAGDENKIPNLLSKLNKSIYIYAGGESNLERKIKLGFNRLSSIIGNIYPIETKNYFNNLLAGKANTETTEKIQELCDIYNLPSMKKIISSKTNIDMGICRSPIGVDFN